MFCCDAPTPLPAHNNFYVTVSFFFFIKLISFQDYVDALLDNYLKLTASNSVLKTLDAYFPSIFPNPTAKLGVIISSLTSNPRMEQRALSGDLPLEGSHFDSPAQRKRAPRGSRLVYSAAFRCYAPPRRAHAREAPAFSQAISNASLHCWESPGIPQTLRFSDFSNIIRSAHLIRQQIAKLSFHHGDRLR